MQESKRRCNQLLKEVLGPPNKAKQQQRTALLVPKPPSLCVYVFPMPKKPGDKLRVVCECLTTRKNGRQGAKELVVLWNTILGMMERYKYPTTIARRCAIAQDTSHANRNDIVNVSGRTRRALCKPQHTSMLELIPNLHPHCVPFPGWQPWRRSRSLARPKSLEEELTKWMGKRSPSGSPSGWANAHQGAHQVDGQTLTKQLTKWMGKRSPSGSPSGWANAHQAAHQADGQTR